MKYLINCTLHLHVIYQRGLSESTKFFAALASNNECVEYEFRRWHRHYLLGCYRSENSFTTVKGWLVLQPPTKDTRW
jgi:hypothetical protein